MLNEYLINKPKELDHQENLPVLEHYDAIANLGLCGGKIIE